METAAPVVFPVADGITAIDTFMGGRARYTAAYLLDATETTLVETGPGTSVEPVAAALDHLGVAADELAHIVLTHIHLDHAGGVGQLARRFPRATVWVHERGAPHIVDPTRLVASTARVWGEAEMRELFGPAAPVAGDRVRPLQDGDEIAMGDRRLAVLETPGHASHHVALVDSRTGAVFTGDALGIHVPDLPVLRPATPPPEFDLERYVASIDRIRAAAAIDPACSRTSVRSRTWTPPATSRSVACGTGPASWRAPCATASTPTSWPRVSSPPRSPTSRPEPRRRSTSRCSRIDCA